MKPDLKKASRVRTIIRKEFKQVLRDPSSIALAIILPLVMIILFGYGLSLDIKNVPIAVVVEDTGTEAMDLARAFAGSPYFVTTITTSSEDSVKMVREHDADGIIKIPRDFGKQFHGNDSAPVDVQVIVNGVDANRGRIIQGYATGVINTWQAKRADRRETTAGTPGLGQASIAPRTWYNPTGESSYFLVPGLLVLVMTLIGAIMTALVMAREWERGTLEAIFVTPVRPEEILLGKTVPYFLLGMIGLALCVLASYFLFHVPLRGSLWLLILVSSIYLLVSLGLGLLISAATKNQFVASQLALLLTFMPAFMLSGFIYDIQNMPDFVQGVTYLIPARYYVGILQTLFLAGNVWSVILPSSLVLMGMVALLLFFTRTATQKKLA